MGLKELITRFLPPSRVEGEALFLLDTPVKAGILVQPSRPNWGDEDFSTCTTCGRPLEERIITTDQPDGHSELWEDVPAVVDGWVCLRCGIVQYPRVMSPERISQLGARCADAAEAGRPREAEWWVMRIVWDWPTYSAGYLDLGRVLRQRIDETPDDQRLLQSRLERRAREAYEAAIDNAIRDPERSPEGLLANAQIGLAELGVERRIWSLARRATDDCLKLEGLSEDARARAEEIARFLDEERWRFGDAAEVISPHMRLMDAEAEPVDTPEKRGRVTKAVGELEEYHREHPSHWQSLFVAGMGRVALDQNDLALEIWRQGWREHPGQPDIAREYGSALLRMELNEEAQGLYRRATELTPEDATLWCNRAVTELLCGDLASASTCIEKSRELDPEDPIAQNVARLLDKLDPNHLPKSMAELKRSAQ